MTTTGSFIQSGDRLFIRISSEIKIELIQIPSGEFWMGSNPNIDNDAENDEQPFHKVFLPEYWIGRTPVTNSQYQIFLKTTGYSLPEHWVQGSPPFSGKENHPVISLRWNDAREFCEWLTKLTSATGNILQICLPSEAEWEKGARGVDGRLYPWGNQIPDEKRCNFNKNYPYTTEIGMFSPQSDSPYGCVDMAGNCYEWTRSVYYSYPYVPVISENMSNPGNRVLRGGSNRASREVVRCAFRGNIGPDKPAGGFRLCISSDVNTFLR